MYDIRRLDIYRKIPKDLTEPTYTGAIISIFCCVFMTFLFISELISFLSVEVISEMYVADESSSGGRIPVQIDVTLPRMQCSYLGLDIQDNLGRHEVGFVDDVALDPINSGEGCRFRAKFKVNKVPGNFHVSTHASRDQPSAPDMSHFINNLMFGDIAVHRLKLPGSFNPMSGRNQSSSDPLNAHEYFLKVVPTVVEEVSGKGMLRSYQYTYAHREYPQQHSHSMAIPAIWFRYDLSAITVKYVEKHKPFYSFLTTVCAIVGGTFTVAGIVDSVVFTASGVFKKAQLGKLS